MKSGMLFALLAWRPVTLSLLRNWLGLLIHLSRLCRYNTDNMAISKAYNVSITESHFWQSPDSVKDSMVKWVSGF